MFTINLKMYMKENKYAISLNFAEFDGSPCRAFAEVEE